MKVTGRTQTRGIVITPAEAENEGVERVLDRIRDVGANAVAVSPGSFVLGTPSDGVREPPLDVEGGNRILDRPLWGKKLQYLKGYSPYQPDPRVWRDVPFPLPSVAPDGPVADYADLVVKGAHARGMESFVITSPTVLPGLPGGQSFTSGGSQDMKKDRLVRVDGSTPRRSIAGQGCVNNPRVQALARARLTETFTHYPDADGLFIDWAEYTCYLPEDIFTCFCGHCELRARQCGYDWEGIRAGVREIFDGLGAVTDDRLRAVVETQPDSVMDGLATLAGASEAARAAARELLRFKAQSVVGFYSSVKSLGEELKSGLEVGANGFAPPWSAITGADFGKLTAVLGVARCKLFTFHWPMMTRWLGEWLLDRNPGITPGLALEAAKAVYQVPTPEGEHRLVLEEYNVPKPDEPHPIAMESLTAKLREAKAQTLPSSRLEAYIHSYRPLDEFERLLEATDAGGTDGMWIQRYGYLSDDKLDVLRMAWKQGPNVDSKA